MSAYELQKPETGRRRGEMICPAKASHTDILSPVIPGSHQQKFIHKVVTEGTGQDRRTMKSRGKSPVTGAKPMNKLRTPKPANRLYTLAGLLASLLFPTQLPADPDKGQICGAEERFMHRRLGSDQQDNLCEVYAGKVLLVVNTASRCAFTGQYEGLENLYAEYQSKGLEVVGFPSNDFGNQEPGDEQSIKKFCRLTYGVKFPMYAKTRVKGEDADPFYAALARAAGHSPRWNFHKYLIDRQGRLVGSYSSFVKPQSETLTKAIEKLL